MTKQRKSLFLMGRIKETISGYILNELKAGGIGDIAPSHGDILMTLYMAAVPLQMKEIATKINRTQPTVTVLVQKLEKAGYLTRIPCHLDGRVTRISLTPKGLKQKELFFQVSQRMNAKLHRCLSDIEAEMLERLLAKILTDLKEN